MTHILYLFKGRELSLARPVLSSSVYGDLYPDNAVDGRFLGENETSAADVASTCFQSAGGEGNPWLTIDLGAMFNVVDIYFYGKRTNVGKNGYSDSRAPATCKNT